MKKNPTGPRRRADAKTGQKVQRTSLATHSADGTVRIVSGRYKRTPITVGVRDGLRPTPSRVRETLFDWLRHLLGDFSERSFLDMFAGSGALGLEAASNGARRVVILEKNRKGAAAIDAVIDKLGARECASCFAADVFLWAEGSSERFDVIFIDPPFVLRLHEKAVAAALPLLKEDGFLYLENEAEIDDDVLRRWGLEAVRRGKAGAVHYLLCTRAIV